MAIERCGRCGTARRGDLQICVRCETPFAAPQGADPDIDLQRPAAPSTFQTHGTMAAMLVVGVVIFGVLLSFAGRDVGPFTAKITGQRPAAAGSVTVTVEVTNNGERAGRGDCQVQVRSTDNIARTVRTFLTERRIPGKGSLTQDVAVPTTDGLPAAVTCA